MRPNPLPQVHNPSLLQPLNAQWHRLVREGDLIYCRQQCRLQRFADRVGHFWHHVGVAVTFDGATRIVEFGKNGWRERKLSDLTTTQIAISIQRPSYHPECRQRVLQRTRDASLVGSSYSRTLVGLLAARAYLAHRAPYPQDQQSPAPPPPESGTQRVLLQAAERTAGDRLICSTFVTRSLAAACPSCGLGSFPREFERRPHLPFDIFERFSDLTLRIFTADRVDLHSQLARRMLVMTPRLSLSTTWRDTAHRNGWGVAGNR